MTGVLPYGGVEYEVSEILWIPVRPIVNQKVIRKGIIHSLWILKDIKCLYVSRPVLGFTVTLALALSDNGMQFITTALGGWLNTRRCIGSEIPRARLADVAFPVNHLTVKLCPQVRGVHVYGLRFGDK